MATNDSSNGEPKHFILPTIPNNETGWGPCGNDWVPEQFKDIPYAPFSKSDRLGRVADWYQTESRDGRDDRRNRRDRNRDQYQAYGSGAAAAFVYQHEDDEGTFSVVDRSAPAKRAVTRPGANRTNRNATRGGSVRGGRGANTRGGRGGRGGSARGGGRGSGWRDYGKIQRTRDASVKVEPDWKVVEEIEFHRLSKLAFEVDDGEILANYGQLHYYDKTYDRVNTKLERPLVQQDRVRYNVTTSDDPIIDELAQANKGTVFATDNVLTMLMCATRSTYSWDIVITHEDGKLYFDKRDGGVFDFISVNENAADPPAEHDKDVQNQPASLAIEALRINEYFANQVVDESKKMDFDKPNPFYQADNETIPPASCAYRYRAYDLSLDEDESCTLIIRSELDAVFQTPSGDALITINALNEYEHRAGSWRFKLDSQRGAVVATEMKNNNLKLARWAAQSILAGADLMKLGYITRANAKDANRHIILGTQVFKPNDFAAQMNLSMKNAWGIVKTVIDICLGLPEGKYVLVKDPNKQVVRLYSVPYGAFDEEDEAELAREGAEEEVAAK